MGFGSKAAKESARSLLNARMCLAMTLPPDRYSMRWSFEYAEGGAVVSHSGAKFLTEYKMINLTELAFMALRESTCSIEPKFCTNRTNDLPDSEKKMRRGIDITLDVAIFSQEV